MAETVESWKLRVARLAQEGLRHVRLPERFTQRDEKAAALRAWQNAFANWLRLRTAKDVFFPYLERRYKNAKALRRTTASKSQADSLLAQGAENALEDLIEDLRNLMSAPLPEGNTEPEEE